MLAQKLHEFQKKNLMELIEIANGISTLHAACQMMLNKSSRSNQKKR